MKSDLWSIGCVFYEMLVGRTPFTATSRIQLERKIVNEKIQVPKQIESQLSEACKDLLLSLLEKDPKKRISWKKFFSHEFLREESLRSGSHSNLQVGFEIKEKAISMPNMKQMMEDALKHAPKVNPFKTSSSSVLSSSQNIKFDSSELEKLKEEGERFVAVGEIASLFDKEGNYFDALVLYTFSIQFLSKIYKKLSFLISKIPSDKDPSLTQGCANCKNFPDLLLKTFLFLPFFFLLSKVSLKWKFHINDFQKKARTNAPLCVEFDRNPKSKTLFSAETLLYKFSFQVCLSGVNEELKGNFDTAKTLYKNCEIIFRLLHSLATKQEDLLFLNNKISSLQQRILYVSS